MTHEEQCRDWSSGFLGFKDLKTGRLSKTNWAALARGLKNPSKESLRDFEITKQFIDNRIRLYEQKKKK